jgi:hypothetical protein
MFICKRIQVTDKDGWQKNFMLEQKPIITIGSGPNCDLVLQPKHGEGVSPLSAQVVISVRTGLCQLVNIGETPLIISTANELLLNRLGTISLQEGLVCRMGDFSLAFYGEQTGSTSADTPKRLGLSVGLVNTLLQTNNSLQGVVTVRNLGDRSTQVELTLKGLDPDCFEIEPGPFLFPNTEKEVVFHIFHRSQRPKAGNCQFTIHACAPQAYPGEEAVASRVIEVAPFFQHRMTIAANRHKDVITQPASNSPATPPPPIENRNAPRPITPAPAETVPPTNPSVKTSPAAPPPQAAPPDAHWEAPVPIESNERQVIKLKAARPAPEKKPDTPANANTDWWTDTGSAAETPQDE